MLIRKEHSSRLGRILSATEEATSKKRKLEPGSIRLQMVGDLMMARPTNSEDASLFRKYEALLEKLANFDKEERLLDYKLLVALMITGHAKKTQDIDERKRLFDLKNQIYFDIANNLNSRKRVAFWYLTSKNFRVTDFCKKCEESNTKQNLPRHQWKFCRDCKLDRKFYNVLSMHHKFPDGGITIFLSNDLITKIKNLRVANKAKLDNQEEGAKYTKYIYNAKSLSVFDLDSVLAAHKKLLGIK